ncbi:hypothetical protein ACGFYZ_40960 [Streptomyces sp. NPDC048330]|uniref:hypothetical protein n=1 Tax=Streptomyces sp. NPDC048330 TaxID=3365533 RepID=UPI0037102456
MTTALDRGERDQIAALVQALPAVPGTGTKSVRVDVALLELAVVLLGQYSAAFGDEPVGRAAGTVADRLQFSVPMTAILAMKTQLESGNLDLR